MPPSPLPMDALLILQSLSQRLLTPWRPSLGPVRSLAISALPGPYRSVSGQHTPNIPSRCSWGWGAVFGSSLPLAVTFLPSSLSWIMSVQLLHMPISSVSFLRGAYSPRVQARADPPAVSARISKCFDTSNTPTEKWSDFSSFPMSFLH